MADVRIRILKKYLQIYNTALNHPMEWPSTLVYNPTYPRPGGGGGEGGIVTKPCEENVGRTQLTWNWFGVMALLPLSPLSQNHFSRCLSPSSSSSLRQKENLVWPREEGKIFFLFFPPHTNYSPKGREDHWVKKRVEHDCTVIFSQSSEWNRCSTSLS